MLRSWDGGSGGSKVEEQSCRKSGKRGEAISLQRRLTLFFIVIVILPLTAAGFVVQRVVVGEIERRALLAIDPALDATVTLYNDRVSAVADRTKAAVGPSPRLASLLARGDRASMDRFLARKLKASENRALQGPDASPGLDFLIALDKRSRVLGSAFNDAAFVTGFDQPSVAEITAAGAGAGAGFNRTHPLAVMIPGRGVAGRVVGGFWLDDDLLVGASRQHMQLSVAASGQIIASTKPIDAPVRVDPSFDRAFEMDLGGEATGEARELGGDTALIASTPQGPIAALSRRVWTSLLGLLALALVATAILAYKLARLVTRDLEELSEGASAIAEGRFDHRIPVRSGDEVGQLAAVFNHMAERLDVTITELSSSRDQLQRAVQRVGETLRSTHDMGRILDSILKTAVDAIDADAATLWKFTPTRDELQPVMATGVDIDELQRLGIGEGVIGLVAERGITISLPGADGGPRPARTEPQLPVSIAIPLYSQDRIAGVIAVYRREEKAFTRKDLDTVAFLAEQGGVAIENVQLHEEAQRLSLTDGLTSVYNRRYYQMQFRQVMATAVRFDRPFSVLMLDLDHFKEINDSHGHQRGDSILIEFAQRVSKTLREVDTFARYGGEEFICLLPETDVDGAATAAEKIMDAIRVDVFGGVGETPVQLTVSIGIACYPQHGDSYRGLVDAADRALYAAKQAGRDRAHVAGEPPPPELKLA